MINAANRPMQKHIKKADKNSMFNNHSLINQYRKHYELILMILPGLVTLILFCYLPMCGILIAFKDYRLLDGIWNSPWVGLEHFKTMFGGTDFFVILRNTAVISLLKLLCGFPAPILLALMLNEVRNKCFQRAIQTMSYLPHFFSWVVLGGIITMIFSYNGPVNILLKSLGLSESIMFFGDKTMFIIMVVLSAVWQGVGWGAIIYIAALAGIDENLYNAAYIDGASRWKQIWHISLPCLLPTIITILILNLGQILNAGFDQIYNLYNPTVYEVADIIDTYVLRKLRGMEYGLGTAVGLFKSLVGLFFVLLTNWFIKKISDNEMGIL